jgi:hypothetical protein
MADIAAIFHWPLSEMAEFELDELLAWHDRAVERFKAMNPKR